MAEFTPITSQEAFDEAIKARLQRERESIEKKYADYETLKVDRDAYQRENETLKEKITSFEADITSLKTANAKYETDSAKTRIGMAKGLSYELCQRLGGTTDEEITADADAFAKLIGERKPEPLPLRNTEQQTDSQAEAYKKMASELTNFD